jgi:hypothetical protein
LYAVKGCAVKKLLTILVYSWSIYAAVAATAAAAAVVLKLLIQKQPAVEHYYCQQHDLIDAPCL